MYVRTAPCLCEHCLAEDWDQCTNTNWERKILKEKGFRNPNMNHLKQQLSARSLTIEEGAWEIVAILQQRIAKGREEYLVQWKGYTECTWVEKSQISAQDLLEDFEILMEISNLQQENQNM